MIKILFSILILVFGIPVGFLLEKRFSDEIKNWRKRIFGLAIVSFICAVFVEVIGYEFKLQVFLILIFMIIVFLTMIWRNYKFK